MPLTWKKNDCRGYDAFAEGRLCYTVENRKYGWYLVRVRPDGSTAGVESVRSLRDGKAYAANLYALTPNGKAA